ncbi:MAG: ATP phosphoribosyltransferase [Defluviitaleaceae bacterium]|nr:ATP phosphoribosyltransferase [Defluviitaleaceae bacterium]
MRKIIIALPKGHRLLALSYKIFKSAGYTSATLEQAIASKDQKQLEHDSDCGKAAFLLVRNADIPQYVDRNWAEIGLTAFDCYREYELSSVMGGRAMRGDNFITDLLPDLALCGQSRFCVAGLPQGRGFYDKCKESDEKILTVATQHPNIAAMYFAGQRILADIVTISGSSELMPAHGGVDAIFDIVETGSALVENGLVIYEEAMPIQTKILVSKAALKYDPNITAMIGVLQNAVKP